MRRILTTLSMLVLLAGLAISGTGRAQIAASITVAPPALPVYTQPPCPEPG